MSSSTTFTVQRQVSLNPGLPTSFPWLAAIASQYTEYRIRGLVFHYIPTSGASVASANPALGSVMFQTSYRATEVAPANKVEMMNEYWASEGRPCDEFCHPIECDPRENPFNIQYVRTGSLPSTENILMYDLGTTTIATTGNTGTGNILGDVWMSYEIELKKPRITTLSTELCRSYSIISQAATTANPIGPANTQTVTSNFPGVFNGLTSVTFPKNTVGTYLISWEINNATSSPSGVSVTYPSGFTILNGTEVVASGSSSSVYNAIVAINTTAAAGIILSATLAGPAVVSQFRITEYGLAL